MSSQMNLGRSIVQLMKPTVFRSSPTATLVSVRLHGNHAGRVPNSAHLIDAEPLPTKEELQAKLRAKKDIHFLNAHGDVVILDDENIETMEYVKKKFLQNEVDEKAWRFMPDDDKNVYEGVARDLGYRVRGDGFQKI